MTTNPSDALARKADRYDEMARECVLRSVNRELKAEAEHHGYTHKPLGSEAFDFANHAALAADVAALVRAEVEAAEKRERDACAKVCLDIAPCPSGEEIIMSHSRWIATSCAAAIRARGGANDPPRCESCGYTYEDCVTHGDHSLCGQPTPPRASHEAKDDDNG